MRAARENGPAAPVAVELDHPRREGVQLGFGQDVRLREHVVGHVHHANLGSGGRGETCLIHRIVGSPKT